MKPVPRLVVDAERAESPWRRPAAVLLISCYELGHQPLGVASPLAFLEHAGYRPSAVDIGVQRLDAEKARRAGFVGISVPMHTALRLGVRAAERVREINPGCHIAFYGLYAHLNSDYLLEHVADSVIGGEFEGALVALVQASDFQLPLLGSNQDSPDPESGVLPVTPRGSEWS